MYLYLPVNEGKKKVCQGLSPCFFPFDPLAAVLSQGLLQYDILVELL